jgi:hypothetical protein
MRKKRASKSAAAKKRTPATKRRRVRPAALRSEPYQIPRVGVAGGPAPLSSPPPAPGFPVDPSGATQPAAAPETAVVYIWEDDPESEGTERILVPPPGNPLSMYQLNILGPAPAPAKYARETPEARYWTAREALVRGRDFWKDMMPADAPWQTGTNLPVTLDAGVQLNAFYNRARGLTFYHDRERGRDVYTCESPDIVLHELGHAILDALQPALWSALTGEIAAFHEAFGDIAALLAGLHQDSLCAHVLNRHGAWIERDSRWTRIGEALGKALNERDPDRASPVCLRNAANGFYYQKPAQLPASGPDSQLTREPHSLSRPFVGAFLQALGGIARTDAPIPTVETLQDTAWKAGGLLLAAIRRAPVQADYFFQVASALVAEAAVTAPALRDAIASAYVRRGILPVEALDQGWPDNPKSLNTGVTPIPEAPALAPLALGAAGPVPAQTSAVVEGKHVGFRLPFKIAKSRSVGLSSVNRMAERGLQPLVTTSLPASGIGAASGASTVQFTLGAAGFTPVTVHETALEHDEEFVHYLFQRGRVEFDDECAKMANTGPMYARKTHRLNMRDGEPTLERLRFDCGFD